MSCSPTTYRPAPSPPGQGVEGVEETDMMTTEITSFDQIAKLRAEAASAGDDAQVELCDIVLHSAGRRLTQDQRREAAEALEACRLAIQDAEAQS